MNAQLSVVSEIVEAIYGKNIGLSFLLMGSRAQGNYRSDSDLDVGVVSSNVSAEIQTVGNIEQKRIPVQINLAPYEKWLERCQELRWSHSLSSAKPDSKMAEAIVRLAQTSLFKKREEKKHELQNLDVEYQISALSSLTLSFLAKVERSQDAIFASVLHSEYLQEMFLGVEAIRFRVTGSMNDAVCDVFIHSTQLGGARFLNPNLPGQPQWWRQLNSLPNALTNKELARVVSDEIKELTGQALTLGPSEIIPSCFSVVGHE